MNEEELITRDDLNNLVAQRVCDILSAGRFIPFTKGAQLPYDEPGFKVGVWDIAKHPNAIGSILRVGFTATGRKDEELKYVFLMELK